MSLLSVFPYPVLTEELHRKIGCTQDNPSFTYQDESGVHKLKYESLETATSTSSVWKVADELGKWHPGHSALDITIGGEIENPIFLFGAAGILPRTDSILGIGMIWIDKESRIRGSLPLTQIPSDVTGPIEYEKTVHFEPGTLRGILSLRTVFYVEKSSGNENGRIFASHKGIILGVLDEVQVVIEGNGSVFPIGETESPDKPLWWIETYIDDPNTDRFDEDHFMLMINKAHKAYPELGIGTGNSSCLLQEIIADALFTLITTVQNTEGGAEALHNNASEAEPGSIAKIISYMIQTNSWKKALDKPEELNRAIHEWAERNI